MFSSSPRGSAAHFDEVGPILGQIKRFGVFRCFLLHALRCGSVLIKAAPNMLFVACIDQRISNLTNSEAPHHCKALLLLSLCCREKERVVFHLLQV